MVAFILVATLNSGGYRFGVGDQAFYLPAIQRHLQPESFPRDRLVIDDQDRLNVFTRVAADVVAATGASTETLCAALYVLTLGLLAWGARAYAGELGLSGWAQAALLAALTLKHRVGLTGANTLEGYAHPRMLAFAVGIAAVVAFFRSRPAATVALVGVAGIVHPTTAMWFAVWLGVALLVSEPRWRIPLAALGVAGCGAAAWAIGWGPLSPQLVRMDAAWLAVLGSKDYLFSTDWPVDMWLVALAYAAVPPAAWLVRRRLGVATPRETGLLAGLVALVGIFLVTLPLVSARVALAVQFQIGRVFWLLDFAATAYIVWMLADLPDARRGAAQGAGLRWTAVITACVLLFAACARGAWVTRVEHPERAIVQATLPGSDWTEAMRWLRTTPIGTHVLADPAHAWRYGTSVRVAAGRDVYFEEVKDTAMAMYSRRVAMRALDRIGALGDFAALTTTSARTLAARFELDYLVTSAELDLPVAHRNATFRIYALR